MNFLEYFKNLFGGKNRLTLNGSVGCSAEASQAYRDMAIRQLAFNAAIGIVSNTISKCEFKTYIGGEEIRDEEHYLWNVRPNANESSSVFLQKFIYRLYSDNECLVIFNYDEKRRVNEAFVADTFALAREYAFKPNIYDAISINNLTLNRSYTADEVLHFKLNNEAVRHLLDLFYDSYMKMIESSLKTFKRSRGEHGVLETERIPGDITAEEYVRHMENDIATPYFNGDNAVMPLFSGQKYTKTSTTGSREITDVEDTRKLINDVFDMTALAFHIPPALLRGEMADTSQLVADYLTFCIDPLCRMISDEINAKRYKRDKFIAGNYIKIDTSNVKHFDILDAATAVDKLISSGIVNINELRAAIDMPEINSEWAKRHFITKNYTQIENLNAIDDNEGR